MSRREAQDGFEKCRLKTPPAHVCCGGRPDPGAAGFPEPRGEAWRQPSRPVKRGNSEKAMKRYATLPNRRLGPNDSDALASEWAPRRPGNLRTFTPGHPDRRSAQAKPFALANGRSASAFGTSDRPADVSRGGGPPVLPHSKLDPRRITRQRMESDPRVRVRPVSESSL